MIDAETIMYLRLLQAFMIKFSVNVFRMEKLDLYQDTAIMWFLVDSESVMRRVCEKQLLNARIADDLGV